MAALYVFGLLLVVGLAQCEPIEPEIAYIEDSLRGSRIVNGWEAENGQFPYTVSIRMVGPTGGVGACTGSILTNEWILTAAHCLARRFTFIVRLGQVDITTPGYMVESLEWYVHGGYIQEETAVQTDDIGVLKLDRYVPYNDYIQPIRIQSSQRNLEEYTLLQLTQSGYGRTDDWWAGGIVPDILYWTYQRGLSMLVCRSWYPHSQVIDDRKTICAQFYNHTSQNPCTCKPAETEIAYIRDSLRGARIVSGWEAVNGQFPYTVSIRNVGPTGGVSACTGSILSNEWILTAAHCLARRFTYIVRLGQVDITTPGYMIETAESYVHGGYDQEETAVQTDDIGVLKLDRYVPYSDYIQPIRIQSSQRNLEEYTLLQLTQSGYGRTDDWWAGGIVPDILYWTYQRGLSMLVCRSWYPHSQVIDDRKTICAQFYNHTSQNPCTGDSGGALTLIDVDGKPTQIGIMSFGSSRGCNTHNPSGYVRPEYYHDWLEETTGINFDWNVEDLETIADGGDDKQQIFDK